MWAFLMDWNYVSGNICQSKSFIIVFFFNTSYNENASSSYTLVLQNKKG